MKGDKKRERQVGAEAESAIEEGKPSGARESVANGMGADSTCECMSTADGSVESLVDEATGRKRGRAARQVSRGGSESKRRREEARQAKREQWQAAQVAEVG